MGVVDSASERRVTPPRGPIRAQRRRILDQSPKMAPPTSAKVNNPASGTRMTNSSPGAGVVASIRVSVSAGVSALRRENHGVPGVTLQRPMSRRHTDASILAAARDSVLDRGMRRTTVADVARRAGASRMTVYRAFPDGATLWSTLLTGEFAATIRAAEEDAAGQPTARARLVEAIVRCVERLARNPLVRRILESDSDLLVPYIVEDLGQSQHAVLAILRRYLQEGQADGSIRETDPGTAAYCLTVVARSFVLSAPVTERETGPTAAYEELRILLDSYLRPGPT
jgi:AcrR family transcriptional regulator